MIKLRALTPLSGDYGFVRKDQVFETDDQRALNLESRGLAEIVHEPFLQRASKMLFGAPENKAVPANPHEPPHVEAPGYNSSPPPVRPPLRAARGQR